VIQAKNNTERVRAMIGLYDVMKPRITGLLRSQHALMVLDTLFYRPIFSSNDFIDRSGISRKTALRFLAILRDERVLFVMRPGSGQQPTVYAFGDLLNCTEGEELFETP
jgi:hypothetical protein